MAVIYTMPNIAKDQVDIIFASKIRGVVGRRVREARLASGMSQTEFGRSISRTQLWVRQIEKGSSNVYITDLYMIASTCGVSVSWLIGADNGRDDMNELIREQPVHNLLRNFSKMDEAKQQRLVELSSDLLGEW